MMHQELETAPAAHKTTIGPTPIDGGSTGQGGQSPPESREPDGLGSDGSGVLDQAPAVLRAKIMELEAAMLAMKDKLIHIEPAHYFASGIYVREIAIPKGVTITGKIHKTEHLCVLTKGEISVMTDAGMRRIVAPAVVKSSPGIKRAIFAHEDSVWMNIHPNQDDAEDLDRIEERLIAKSFDEIPGFSGPMQISRGNN